MFEWFTVLQTEVQVAIVALLSAVSVTLIPLFKNTNASESKSTSAEIVGAIVDNTIIKDLILAIKLLTETLSSNNDKIVQNLDNLNDELSRLREEMIRGKKD